MQVFGLSHTRSRELYDLTMLEVRRVLYDDVKRRSPITPDRLAGTRSSWMTRFATLLTAEEFSRFVVLMAGLAPYLIFLVDPQNRGHRQDRNPEITRRNLELILFGHPDAVALFSGLSSARNRMPRFWPKPEGICGMIATSWLLPASSFS
jgi:hypothetical protein